MDNKIRLKTHDGSRNYLEHLYENKYKLVTQFDFIRGGQVTDGREFIDPSGGPMLVVGEPIEGTPYIIESLSFQKGVGHILTLIEQ
jgi:hypothetical protein